ncbi:hypothetical protein FTW19_02270 [Terriglobus albidus]|uniref:Zf-HC2 domain-containing protein n=1 Tax=Terriglobus albidus TaxID=1592106 RepID=A0A5B9E3U8_9BACT|nr:hypothetical protein [Terriglobus albidus]QEE26932.1 hypothetical protein FTW19_02270 [Terriglobus albidus]
MNLNGCTRLEEVRHALSQGHWPQACAELQAHVQTCTRCTEEVLVTKHLQGLRATAIAVAQPGSASLLWWKAQARRRSTVVQQMERPLLAGQLVALAIVLTIVAGIVMSHSRGVWTSGAATTSNAWNWLLDAWGLLPVLAAAGVVVLLAAVVLYLVLPVRYRDQRHPQNG